MDRYVTGSAIKAQREKCGLTQLKLAEILNVSDKTVSKWETGNGYPDITLIEPIAKALKISVVELMSGEMVTNTNTASNMLRSKLYVCPICGNVLFGTGDAVISCHGITLPPLVPEKADDEHKATAKNVEDEYLITIDHEMTKSHYISFIASLTFDGFNIVKLYPEGSAEARINRRGTKKLFFYCNKDGLFEI